MDHHAEQARQAVRRKTLTATTPLLVPHESLAGSPPDTTTESDHEPVYRPSSGVTQCRARWALALTARRRTEPTNSLQNYSVLQVGQRVRVLTMTVAIRVTVA